MVNINTYSFVNLIGKSVLKANFFIKHEHIPIIISRPNANFIALNTK